ncbi:hypothetical protein NP493_608g02022 [Ridgeia piscesae]|uniref:Uncharacterized protein n=1 Tax=Ridgeia piscesae TaxID=27915 RepID=A0AAD9KTN4_RIDPI|nr:hypothetical protein NP493_608g02022 [Ridgeia piscesae]
MISLLTTALRRDGRFLFLSRLGCKPVRCVTKPGINLNNLQLGYLRMECDKLFSSCLSCQSTGTVVLLFYCCSFELLLQNACWCFDSLTTVPTDRFAALSAA